MPADKSSRGTRDRVLDMALGLLNDRGVERVTTRLIAETVGINEGNLYYYFRTKEALLIALFDRFEAEVRALLEGPLPDEGSNLGPYSALLHKWFLLTWSYRFLFRDLMVLQTAPALQARLRAATTQLRRATRAVFDAMQNAGLIAIPPRALENLLANLWIVSTYWISYLMLHDGVETVTSEHLNWGLGQLRSLYSPYLTEAARSRLGGA